MTFAVLAMLLAGCGGGVPPITCGTLPDLAADRDSAIDGLGRDLWDALASGRPWTFLLGDDELHALIVPDHATRFAVRRSDAAARLRGSASRVPEAIDSAEYLGICAQDSREEPAGTSLGLRSRAWVVSRALVAGRIGGGSRRIALWVDGAFVATSRGFRAIDLERIETPRWEHSDLEILACDISEGL